MAGEPRLTGLLLFELFAIRHEKAIRKKYPTTKKAWGIREKEITLESCHERHRQQHRKLGDLIAHA